MMEGEGRGNRACFCGISYGGFEKGRRTWSQNPKDIIVPSL